MESMVYLYVDPENADMEAMFSGIVDNVVICKDENGAVYWPEFGLITLVI